MAKLSPVDGGCWYCHTDDASESKPLTFCWEFDTFIHVDCIKQRGQQNEERGEYDPEWEIIAREFGI